MEKELALVEEMISISKELFEYNKDKDGAGEFKEQIRLWESIKSFLIELKQIKETNPSETLECSLKLYKMVESTGNGWGFDLNKAWKYYNTIKSYILNTQENEKENAELLCAVALLKQKLEDTDNIKIATTMMKQLDTNLNLEKENTELKRVLELIKRVYTDLCFILSFGTFEEYDRACNLISVEVNLKRVDKEEFDTLKRWAERIK